MNEPRWLRGVTLAYILGVTVYAVAAWPVTAFLLARIGSAWRRQPWLAPVAGGVELVVVATLTVLGVLVFRAARARPQGTRGRARSICIGVSGILLLVSHCAVAALLVWGSRRAAAIGLVQTMVVTDAALALPVGLRVALSILVVLSIPALVTTVGCALGSWFLLPRKFRRVFWASFDVLLLIGFIVVTASLPLTPHEGAPNALLFPTIRLTITVLFALRLIARGLPPVLDLVEAVGFRPLVAARHLRAKKSSFLAAIGALAILAVAFSSCSLTTTLSVMGGFRNDLKRKILGNHAHIVVDKAHATFEGWEPVLQKVRRTPGVTGASPFVGGEVMVTSASNLAGAVLRGIDPQSIGQATDLPRNLVHGKLEYLVDPGKLVDLPGPAAATIRGSSRSSSGAGEDQKKAGDGAGLVRDIDSQLGAPEDAPSDKPATNLDAFLRAPDDKPRELLPGIIVGQELARALRLFVGDEVNVVSPLGDLGPSGPMPKSRPFRVAGIFYSGMYEYDMKYAYVLLEIGQRFLSTGDAISGIEIKVADVERAPVVARDIERRIERRELRVLDWQELNKNLFGALALEKLAMFITLGIAILVAGFCVFGTLTLMVQEKGREVGILKAMGAKSGTIVAVFMIEGLLIGLFGAALGLGFGFVVCYVAEHFGVQMNPEVYYIDKLPVSTDTLEFTLVGLACATVCLLATIFPALLASRLQPVDALRYD